MTQIVDIDSKCSVCGKTSKHPGLLSTNQSGYSDLDTRPPERMRSTMMTWVYECPHCGYVASELGDDLIIDKEFLNSESYTTCDGITFKSELSEKFYKQYLIANEKLEDISAFNAILHCAWACDDLDDVENAIHARNLAIEIADKTIAKNDENKTNLIVMKSDFLRRTNQFDRLIEEYENLTVGDELLDNIIKFEVEKAYEKDNMCYTIEEVV